MAQKAEVYLFLAFAHFFLGYRYFVFGGLHLVQHLATSTVVFRAVLCAQEDSWRAPIKYEPSQRGEQR